MPPMGEVVKLLATLTMMAGFGGGGYVIYRFAMAGLRRYEHKDRAAEAVPAAELAERLERMEQDIGELHERVEFAERILAEHREAQRLTAGGR